MAPVRGDEPARLLEVISSAGLENYFRGLPPLLGAIERDEAAIAEVVGTIPVLAERHRLRLR